MYAPLTMWAAIRNPADNNQGQKFSAFAETAPNPTPPQLLKGSAHRIDSEGESQRREQGAGA
jgi:hypothetical protein